MINKQKNYQLIQQHQGKAVQNQYRHGTTRCVEPNILLLLEIFKQITQLNKKNAWYEQQYGI